MLPPQPQPTVVTDDGTRTLRLREHGNKSLPLPPFIDPIVMGAKRRYKTPKLESEEDTLTDFRRELASNPYGMYRLCDRALHTAHVGIAQALATTIRQCNVSKARLPTHFLQPFSTVLPEPSISMKEAMSGTQTTRPRPTLVPVTARTNHRYGTSWGSSSYVLNHSTMTDYLNKRKNWTTVVTLRMQEAYLKRVGRKRVKVSDEWVWKANMPERIREQLEANVVRGIKEMLQDESGELYIERRQIENMPRTGMAAIVELGPPSDVLSTPDGKATIPIYRLPDLLGYEAFSSLPIDNVEEALSSMGVLQHPRNSKLLLALDKLDMYTKSRVIPTR